MPIIMRRPQRKQVSQPTKSMFDIFQLNLQLMKFLMEKKTGKTQMGTDGCKCFCDTIWNNPNIIEHNIGLQFFLPLFIQKNFILG